MEIKTCEQYVLDQLMDTENEVYVLSAEIDEFEARCAKLEAELKARDERDASKVEHEIRKEGNAKRALLQLLTMARMRPDGVWDGD